MKVELRYFDDCPSWKVTDAHLQSLVAELRFHLSRRLVESPDEAESLEFRGSPSVIVDGHDPFAAGDEPVGLSCRIYQTSDGPGGSPTIDQLRAVLTS